MRNLLIRELIFLAICVAVSVAYLGLGYLLAPQIPNVSKIVKVTNDNDIVESMSIAKESRERRSEFFSAWVRWGLVGGVGTIILVSIVRARLADRKTNDKRDKKRYFTGTASLPFMSTTAWFYAVACVILLLVLIVVLSLGL